VLTKQRLHRKKVSRRRGDKMINFLDSGFTFFQL